MYVLIVLSLYTQYNPSCFTVRDSMVKAFDWTVTVFANYSADSHLAKCQFTFPRVNFFCFTGKTEHMVFEYSCLYQPPPPPSPSPSPRTFPLFPSPQDPASQDYLFRWVRGVEDRMKQAGIPVNNPRKQPFHCTMALVDHRYPVDSVEAILRKQIPLFATVTFDEVCVPADEGVCIKP